MVREGVVLCISSLVRMKVVYTHTHTHTLFVIMYVWHTVKKMLCLLTRGQSGETLLYDVYLMQSMWSTAVSWNSLKQQPVMPPVHDRQSLKNCLFRHLGRIGTWFWTFSSFHVKEVICFQHAILHDSFLHYHYLRYLASKLQRATY